MDPDANLEEQRALVRDIIKKTDVPDGTQHTVEQLADIANDAIRLAELVQALDEWITKRGYLPGSWGKHWRGVRS